MQLVYTVLIRSGPLERIVSWHVRRATLRAFGTELGRYLLLGVWQVRLGPTRRQPGT